MLVSLLFVLAPLGRWEASSAPPAAVAPRPSATDAAAARAELVRQLLALASWANQNELFLQRDQVWRSVLVLEPDNGEARKGLRYSRDGQGRWKDPPEREVKDRKPALIPELVSRRGQIVSVWRTHVLAALEAEKAPRESREAAMAEILRIDPEDAVVHGLRGEVRAESGWLLAESVGGAARHAQLAALAHEALQASVQTEPAGAAREDLAYLPAWKVALGCEGLRVLSQTSEDEARSLLQVQHAARALLGSVCGKPLAPSPGFSAYVLVESGERESLLAALPEASAEEKKSWIGAPGFGIPHRAAVVVWHADPKCRLDCFTRHFVASCLFAGYGLEARTGWVMEGLGLYLTHALTGTRETWFHPDQAGDESALRKRLRSSKTDWRAEARKLVADGHAPKLAELVEKPLGTMNLADMLLATLFAQYLAEGQAQALPELLDRIGRGGGSAATLAVVLGRPLPEIEARFLRWLVEQA